MSRFQMRRFPPAPIPLYAVITAENAVGVTAGDVLYNTTEGDYSAWTKVATSEVSLAVDIAWIGDKYVLLHANGKTSLSVNGKDWTAGGTIGGTPQRLLWMGNILVAYGTGSTTYYTSPDGVTWTSRTAPSTMAINSGAFNGTAGVIPIAGSSGSILYSTTGTSWSTKTLPSTQTWNGVAWNGTNFAAICGTNGVSAYSADGDAWSAGSGPGSATGVGCIAAFGSIFCAGSTNASTNNRAVSTDNGQNWSVNNDTGGMNQIFAVDTGFIMTRVGNQGTVRFSATGGSGSWSAINLPNSTTWGRGARPDLLY